MARKKKEAGRFGLLPAALLLGLLLFWGSLGLPEPGRTAAPDIPAADEPLALPQMPAEPVMAAESAALPPLPETPAQTETPAVSILGTTSGGSGSGTVYFKNQTKYEIDMESLLRQPCPVALGREGVQVLIMHTHGTEAYTPTDAHPYQASGEYRTTDKACNMLAVGQRITDLLNERGISTVHSETLNDYPAYNGSYSRALKDINAWLKEYPSIRLVIDVHRDAIGTAGKYYKTIAKVDGQQTAQLMFVTGTDEGGLKHPDWRKNLTFQAQLQDRINGACPGMMRPISIRSGRFNQHVRLGSMLVEVGSCGNTLEEALAAAEVFARSLADALLEQ